MDIFNTTTNTWSLDSLSNGRSFAAATSVNNLFMIGGGILANGNPTNTVEIYSVTNTGIEQVIDNNSAFALIPNPITNSLKIKTNEAIANGNLEIINAWGTTVFKTTFTSLTSEVNITTNKFSAGIYFVKVADGKNVFTQKLIKH